MGRKTHFIYPSGDEGMIIDCNDYEVEICKSPDKNNDPMIRNFGRCIKYKSKKKDIQCITPHVFYISWDSEEDGGKLYIKQRDAWGSEMIFQHYYPSDLKGMFDFIAKGYNIYDKII